MLSACQVLDLSDERGQLAGMILAQLGAEVIAVEPPGGVRSRQLRPSPALHLAFNRGKRSVVLDPADDRERFLDLVAASDVLIESFDHDTFHTLGVDYQTLSAVNPRLIVVSISAFGRTGPKAGWAASDLIAEAASCELYLTGDADRAPVRVSYPQAFLNAAADAACATLVALREREHSGVGQWADISAQEAAAMMTQGQILAAGYGADPLLRNGGGLRVGPLDLRWLYPAADGWVTITLLFGPIAPFTIRLVDWLIAEGFRPPDAAPVDWVNFLTLVLSGELDPCELDLLQEQIAAFTAAHTKAELLEGALQRRVLLAPVSTVAELLASDQLRSRGYWSELDGLSQPGPFIKLGGGPALQPLGPAPRLGADTETVLAGVPRRPGAVHGPVISGAERIGPLRGVKVLDFTWFMAGPATTRMLADWGATVVRVESARRPDGGRGSGPFLSGRADPDSGGYGLTHNAGKLGLALDLSNPQSQPVLDDLVAWADVAVVNYSPRATRNLGLDWETLRALNPQLILVSTCLMGQSGPLAEFSGFGNLSAAIAGFYEVGGWADRPPIGPYLAYTDVVAPRFTFCTILAALDERTRTGCGRYLDVSQAEASMWLLGPAVLDYQLSGRMPMRAGNEDPNYVPHGVYRTNDSDDSWVAVACTDDDHWARLAAVLAADHPELAAVLRDPVLSGVEGRLACRDQLDELISNWTVTRSGAVVESCLQTAGVPAHRVLDSAACWADEQLAHRGHFQTLTHPHHGTVTVQGPRLSFSRTVPSSTRAAPPLGEDTYHVLTDLLGYDGDRVAELAVADVLQ